MKQQGRLATAKPQDRNNRITGISLQTEISRLLDPVERQKRELEQELASVSR